VTAPEEEQPVLDPWDTPENRGAPVDPGQGDKPDLEPAEPVEDEEVTDGTVA
jgi:hypothetical protein